MHVGILASPLRVRKNQEDQRMRKTNREILIESEAISDIPILRLREL